MSLYQTPGVYYEEFLSTPPTALRTGVPALLGFTKSGPANQPQPLTRVQHFAQRFTAAVDDGYLDHAVRGFFENGGGLCYLVRLDESLTPIEALRRGLDALAPLDTVDLVCAPDMMRTRNPVDIQAMQGAVLEHCTTLGDRFAILDAPFGADQDAVLAQAQQLNSADGALYFPWLDVGLRPAGQISFIPPCGHIAGIYARSDERVGVHKAPANEPITGVLDIEQQLTDAQQASLNSSQVNCLRSFPGRGIRVWGARALSQEMPWRYVNTRRLFLTVGRWVTRNLADVAFEPNDPLLWARIEREVTTYCTALFQQGALRGDTPQEAFYVRCDEETNPAVQHAGGTVLTEIGLAPSLPNEFIVVRMLHGAAGVTLANPNLAG